MIKKLNIKTNKKELFFNRVLMDYFGIGKNQAKRISMYHGFAKEGSLSLINYNDLIALEEFLRKNLKMEYFLKLDINNNVQKLKNIKSYKGFRHRYRLPVHGQTSRVNSSTIRNYKLPVLEKKYIEDIYKLIKSYNNK